MPRSHRRSALVAAVALTAAPEAAPAVVAQPPAPAPPGDDFYIAPDPLPAGEPGDIVRWRPTSATSWQVLSVINESLDNGYAVAVTDYEGYRPVEVPTYVTGRSEGNAVLDSVRALRNLDEAGVGEDGPVALQGYSQGGGGSLWAAEVAPGYAPELDLVASTEFPRISNVNFFHARRALD